MATADDRRQATRHPTLLDALIPMGVLVAAVMAVASFKVLPAAKEG